MLTPVIVNKGLFRKVFFCQKIIQILQNDIINLRWILNAVSGDVMKEREGSLSKSRVILRAALCQDVSTSQEHQGLPGTTRSLERGMGQTSS